MEAPKKRTGRPRKRGAERLEQFSIRLNQNRKLELSLIARARGESLAQSIDYLIGAASESFMIDDIDVKTHVTEGLYTVFKSYANIAPDKSTTSVEALWEVVNKNPASNLALVLPFSLLSEDEQYFRELLTLMTQTGKGKEIAWELAEDGSLDALLLVAQNARLVGLGPEDIVDFKGGGAEMHILIAKMLDGIIDHLEKTRSKVSDRRKRQE